MVRQLLTSLPFVVCLLVLGLMVYKDVDNRKKLSYAQKFCACVGANVKSYEFKSNSWFISCDNDFGTGNTRYPFNDEQLECE